MKTLFYNAKILDVIKGSIIEGSVEVTDNIITKVGRICKKTGYDRIIDCKGNILMPGFVDTHCHTPMTLLRSFKDDANLQDWLFNNILPTEAKLTGEDIYWGEYLGIAESLRAGITTLEEGYFNNSYVYKAINQSGIRARIGMGPTTKGVMNNAEFLQNELDIIKTTHLISPALFVHAIYTIGKDTILDSIAFANSKNVPLTIHLAETKKEVDDCLSSTGKTPTEYLKNLGFFSKPSIAYHCVHMTDSDLDILAKNNVSVSTCPSSNIKLASGIARIPEMLQRGINVTIGTDGVASNNSLDMFKEMFLVATLSKVNSNNAEVVPAIDVLRMATINGAKALNINSGAIEVGKEADIIMIDIHSPHYYPHDNLISHLVYAGKSSDVKLTMVAGNILYNDGKYNINKDIETIYKKADSIRQRLKK